jgi:hypothetical protein
MAGEWHGHGMLCVNRPLVFLERFWTLLCYVPLHFTSLRGGLAENAIQYLSIVITASWIISAHLADFTVLIFYYVCYFMVPPSHQNHSSTASHILTIIPFISFLDFKMQ